jgi:hypothetical protein
VKKRQYRIARSNYIVDEDSWGRPVNPKVGLRLLVCCLIIFKSREIKPSQSRSDSNKEASLHKPLEYAREKRGLDIQLPTYLVFHFPVFVERLLKSSCPISSFPTLVHSSIGLVTYEARVLNSKIRTLYL